MACGPTGADPAAPAAAPEPAARAEAAATPEPELELLDPGNPPRRALSYALEVGTTSRFRLEQLMRGLVRGREVGRVAVSGPLHVRVLDAASPRAFSLRLELGPLKVSQSGELRGMRVAGGQGDASVRLTAELGLTPNGRVERSRVLEQQTPELVRPMLETLLGLDGPPTEAVGAGARWQRSQERVRSEYQLLSVTEELATYRVWRAQSLDGSSAAAARSIGEWSWSRRHWPPSGSDRMNLGAPAPDAPSIVVSFEVRPEGAEGSPPPR